MTMPLPTGDGAGERARLHAVRLAVLAASSARGIDRLVRLAARMLDAPVAQASLVGRVEVVVSRGDLPMRPEDRVLPLAEGLGALAVSHAAPLVVSDAAADARYAQLPVVAQEGVAAWCGVPLVSPDGLVLGAVAAWDRRPRRWRDRDVEVLGELAGAVADALAAAVDQYRRAGEAARVEQALADADFGTFDWDIGSGEIAWDDALAELHGSRHDDVARIESLRARVHAEDLPAFDEAVRRALEEGGELVAGYRVVLPDGDVRDVEARGRVLLDVAGAPARLLGAAYDATHLRRSAQALERLVAERELALRAEAAAGERLGFLAEASGRLSASLEPQQVLSSLAEVLLPARARWVVVALTAETAVPLLGEESDGSSPRLLPVLVEHVDPERREDLAALVDLLPLTTDDAFGAGAVVRTGEPQWLPDAGEQLLALVDDEQVRERLRSVAVENALVLPLVSRGRTLGAMTVAQPTGGALEQPLLVDLAARAALALDNALLYRSERRAGVVLQRSLLPQRVPQLPGLPVAVRYLPGTDGAFVGGDWYQGVEVGGELVLAMGDVMGHGLRSAARMGQLRAIVATLALEGHRPGPLLERLSENVDVLLDLELATLLVAAYDPQRRVLALASAGHPPPLLAPANGGARYLDVDPGPPLGSFPASFGETELAVPPGAALVLFTDGLVEVRGEGVGPGLERLRAAAEGVDLPPQQLADHLLAATGRREGGDDDVALLVLRHLP